MNLASAYKKVKIYLNNTLWIMGDKVTNLAVNFLLTVVIARYLGPEDFGLFSYAISVSALFAAAGHMGLSGLVVRELVKKPEERGATLGTTLVLKSIGMSGGYIILLLYALLYEGYSSDEFILLALAGFALLLRPFDIFDFWFQAFLQARYVTIARLAGLTASSALKFLFVFAGGGVIYFVGANVVQAAVVALVFLILYLVKSNLQLSGWSFNCAKAKELFSQGWMVYLGSIFAVIYLKVDQIMLRWFEGSDAVGIYAVAAQISEAWYFIPVAIVTSFFPKLIKLKEESDRKFNFRLQQLFDVLFFLALVVALIITFLSDWLVFLFFGEHYAESSGVLTIHIWAALFIFMRAAFSKWILIENLLVFSLITQGLGAFLNVALNYFLIPRFGVQGAAFATLISYAFASYFSLAVYEKTRPLFIMMTKSIFSILRYSVFRNLK